MAEIVRDFSEKHSGYSSAIKNWRWGEFALLLMAAAVVIFGLFLVYQAKTNRPVAISELSANENLPAILADDPEKITFSAYSQKVSEGTIVNINTVREAKELLPVLSFVANESERVFVAGKLVEIVKQHRISSLSELSTSQIARMRRGEIDQNPNLEFLRDVLSRERTDELSDQDPNETRPDDSDRNFNIVRPFIPELRNQLVVRGPTDFTNSYIAWAVAFFATFFIIHVFWSFFSLKADQILLPVVFVLCGLGFIVMTTLYDPLRDRLNFAEFAFGGLVGLAVMLLVSFSERFIFRIRRSWRHLMQIFSGRGKWVPLGLAFILSVLLILFGNGPGGTKVNLGIFQPSEFIKILVVFFFAAYFAEKAEYLKEIRDERFRFLPRLGDLLPVALAVTCVFALFFLQKDLGPALIIIFTFLILYAIARRRFVLASAGFLVFVGLLTFSFFTARPTTVYERTMIWWNVWENGLGRGDQIARGLWALASGGFYGTGLGLGDPSQSTIPAGHTDLVLASVGEELGFIGVALVLLLYLVLVIRFLYITIYARRDANFFLGLGLTLLFAVQIALIVSGVLGLFPLTGVVNPFLSWGKSSMIANFILVGLLAAISDDSRGEVSNKDLKRPAKAVGLAFACLILLFGVQAYRIQVSNGDENVARAILTREGDGVYRYKDNPRLLEVSRLLPKGTIYDVNGIPLATSDCKSLADRRDIYQNMGYAIENCEPGKRNYPFYRNEGASLFHLLGDARSRKNWTGLNLFIEKDQQFRLQGFDDNPKNTDPESRIKTVYELDKDGNQIEKQITVNPKDHSEVVPLLRYRHFTWEPDLQKLWNRPRDVKTTIDVRLQIEVARIIKEFIDQKNLKKAAAVVVDPVTGDVLASVSYPWFSEAELQEFIKNPAKTSSTIGANTGNQVDPRLVDRARIADYFPGSTFKILTAIAGLKKDPKLFEKTYRCEPLAGEDRVGFKLQGFGPIRDDEGDRPHGNVNMKNGIVHSCNAYFAQLGVGDVKDIGLWETSKLMGIQFTLNPLISSETGKKINVQNDLKNKLAKASFGQEPAKATPLQMAQVAATIANQGMLVSGRWLLDKASTAPIKFIEPASAQIIADAMRGVVTDGTASKLRAMSIPIAGKTGTAEVGPNVNSHSWFIGFAPYGGRRKLAFAVLFENGGYGGDVAAPAAAKIVAKAAELKLFD